MNYGPDWCIKHESLKCLGCDTVSLRRTRFELRCPDENGDPVFTVVNFPPEIFRRPPAWLCERLSMRLSIWNDKQFIPDLIHELYVCLQHDCPRSAAMSVRALLEQVMIDKVGDQHSFKANINKFEAEGFISARQREFLDTVIDAGHATIHRAFKPSKDDLVALVNIAESVVESAYVNEHRANQLKKGIPSKKT